MEYCDSLGLWSSIGARAVSILKGGEWMMASVLEELKANEREVY